MRVTGYGDGFLHRLDLLDRSALMSGTDFRQYAAGNSLITAGNPSRGVIFIYDGLVQVTSHSRPEQIALLRVCGPGQIIGEDALLNFRQRSHRRRTVTATALTKCDVYATSKEKALEFLNFRPHLWEILMQDLIQRAVDDEARITSLACDNADRRLALLLWDLERHGGIVQPDGGHRLPLPLSQADLAMWISASRETVERTLSKWRRRGIVTTAQRSIVIRDTHAMAAIAGILDQRMPGNAGERPASRHVIAVI